MIQPDPEEIERTMKKYYLTLSEKDQRRYAAVEALKLGQGGQIYIARILGCNERTVHNGLRELAELPDEPEYEAATRQAGGGRKRYDEHYRDIDAQFLRVLKEHTAGDPMDEKKVVWTDLTPRESAKRLDQDHQVKVSKSVVNKRILLEFVMRICYNEITFDTTVVIYKRLITSKRQTCCEAGAQSHGSAYADCQTAEGTSSAVFFVCSSQHTDCTGKEEVRVLNSANNDHTAGKLA